MEILESLHGLATKNNGNVDPPTEPVMAGPLGSVEAVLAFDETLTGGYREALVSAYILQSSFSINLQPLQTFVAKHAGSSCKKSLGNDSSVY